MPLLDPRFMALGSLGSGLLRLSQPTPFGTDRGGILGDAFQKAIMSALAGQKSQQDEQLQALQRRALEMKLGEQERLAGARGRLQRGLLGTPAGEAQAAGVMPTAGGMSNAPSEGLLAGADPGQRKMLRLFADYDPEAVIKSMMETPKAPTVQEFYDDKGGRPYKATWNPTTRQWDRTGGMKASEGPTMAQTANNREITAARERLLALQGKLKPGQSLGEYILSASQKATDTGRTNTEYNALVERDFRIATQAMVGGDPEFENFRTLLDAAPARPDAPASSGAEATEEQVGPGLLGNVMEFFGFGGGESTASPSPMMAPPSAMPAPPSPMFPVPGRKPPVPGLGRPPASPASPAPMSGAPMSGAPVNPRARLSGARGDAGEAKPLPRAGDGRIDRRQLRQGDIYLVPPEDGSTPEPYRWDGAEFQRVAMSTLDSELYQPGERPFGTRPGGIVSPERRPVVPWMPGTLDIMQPPWATTDPRFRQFGKA